MCRFNKILSPFKENLPTFVLLVACCFLEVCYYLKTTYTGGAIGLLLVASWVSYLFTLPLGFLGKRVGRLYKVFVFFIFYVNALLDFCFITKYGILFNEDMAAIICGTNRQEAIEYLETYVDGALFLYCLLSLVGCVALYYAIVRLSRYMNRALQIVALCMVCFGFMVVLLFRPEFVKEHGLTGKIYWFTQVETPPDLKAYSSVPELETVCYRRPRNIVMIIGESFAKGHSSLYGYEKETNPCLAKLQADSLLFVFDHVVASGAHTIEAFKGFMSTYRAEYGDTVEWYSCPTLVDVLRACHYKTTWISNQSKSGFYDNLISKYAELCDTCIFIGDKMAGMTRKTFDGELVEVTRKVKRFAKGNQFYFIHLLGSHARYCERYPSAYNQFDEKEYQRPSEHQRIQLATYDNSILYNDFVVSELMKLFVDEESIVFYFSDHGLDIYQSNADYFGHAISGVNEHFGLQIPFVVFTSSLFQIHYPQLMQRIKGSLNRTYNTEDMIYTVMDVLGVTLSDNTEVSSYSLFR